MSNGNKFYSKRTHEAGVMRVQTGFRKRQGQDPELQFRFPVPGGTPISLTYDQAEDLADALDQALAAQEDDPLS